MQNLMKEQKDEIRARLLNFIEVVGSANKTATKLGVSAATISAIKNEKYDSIADDMWVGISNQINRGADASSPNATVETSVYRDLNFCFEESRTNKRFQWAVSPAGSGKTVLARQAATQPNTFYVLCDEDMCKSDFTRALAKTCGLNTHNQKPRSIIIDVVRLLKARQNALLIIDEADKLSDNILNYFITIYNHLEDMSGQLTIGVVFTSTNYIERRMRIGLEYNKRGYSELWSRLGAKFYVVDGNTAVDVENICRARGLTSQRSIDEVVKEAELVNYDLRRVARKISVMLRQSKAIEANGN